MIFMRVLLRATTGLFHPRPSKKPDAPASAMAGISTTMPARMAALTAAIVAALPESSAASVDSQKRVMVRRATPPAIA